MEAKSICHQNCANLSTDKSSSTGLGKEVGIKIFAYERR